MKIPSLAVLAPILMWIGIAASYGDDQPKISSRPAFFAMDTIARGQPDTVVPLLKDLGYDGLGGTAGDGSMASALEAAGLKFFNGYITLQIHGGQPILTDEMRAKIDAMAGHQTTLWAAISKVDKAGQPFKKSDVAGDEVAVPKLLELAEYAGAHGVKIALYPHTGSWLERVEDAIRLAGKLHRDDVGVTFNLCHWLKVEGPERDPVPVLKEALPKLMFVTINGADTGDTKAMGWDRLIQPLDNGSYDVAAFLKKVRDVGYAGPIGFQGYGLKGDEREILRRTMAAWRKMTGE